MDDAGKWHSETPGVAEYLDILGKYVEAKTYLPDQWQPRLEEVIREAGAQLVDHKPPESESVPGRIY